MSVIYYRFRSSNNSDTVKFDDVQISVGELRALIMQKERMSKGGDYDLQILNAQSSRVYDKNEEMIPRNSSVIVSRVPRIGGSSKKRETEEDTKMSKAREAAAQSLLTTPKPRTEDEALKLAMQQQQSLINTDSNPKSRYANPPPASYVCFRCNRGGHWIQHCPGVAAGDGVEAKIVKKSTGIPSSFMKIVNDPTIPGAMLTPSGHYAVPILEAEAYKEQKREKMPFGNDENPEYRRVDRTIPPELKCGICNGILRQAVVIPCCGTSFCDECIRNALLESAEQECPNCHETESSPDKLVPNQLLRKAVEKFLSEGAYARPAQKLDSDPANFGVTIGASLPKSQVEPPPAAASPSVPIEMAIKAVVDQQRKRDTPTPDKQSSAASPRSSHSERSRERSRSPEVPPQSTQPVASFPPSALPQFGVSAATANQFMHMQQFPLGQFQQMQPGFIATPNGLMHTMQLGPGPLNVHAINQLTPVNMNVGMPLGVNQLIGVSQHPQMMGVSQQPALLNVSQQTMMNVNMAAMAAQSRALKVQQTIAGLSNPQQQQQQQQQPQTQTQQAQNQPLTNSQVAAINAKSSGILTQEAFYRMRAELLEEELRKEETRRRDEARRREEERALAFIFAPRRNRRSRSRERERSRSRSRSRSRTHSRSRSSRRDAARTTAAASRSRSHSRSSRGNRRRSRSPRRRHNREDPAYRRDQRAQVPRDERHHRFPDSAGSPSAREHRETVSPLTLALGRPARSKMARDLRRRSPSRSRSRSPSRYRERRASPPPPPPPPPASTSAPAPSATGAVAPVASSEVLDPEHLGSRTPTNKNTSADQELRRVDSLTAQITAPDAFTVTLDERTDSLNQSDAEEVGDANRKLDVPESAQVDDDRNKREWRSERSNDTSNNASRKHGESRRRRSKESRRDKEKSRENKDKDKDKDKERDKKDKDRSKKDKKEKKDKKDKKHKHKHRKRRHSKTARRSNSGQPVAISVDQQS